MLKKILQVVVLLLLSAQLLVVVKAAGQAVILQHTGYIAALTGSYHVVGEIQNTGDKALRFVKITATFYDSAGTVIATDFTYTTISRLHPGQKSPFEVILLDKTQSSKVHDYELGVTYEQYESLPVGLEILSHSKNKDAVGFLHVVGEIKNIGDVDAHSVKVAVTFYDSAGKIVAVSFGFTDPMDLTPGQKAPFEIVLFDLNRSKLATTYALEAQSEEYNIIPEFPAVALILPVAILLALGVLRRSKVSRRVFDVRNPIGLRSLDSKGMENCQSQYETPLRSPLDYCISFKLWDFSLQLQSIPSFLASRIWIVTCYQR